MQVRDPLEIALKSAITSHNTERALSLIDIILKEPPRLDAPPFQMLTSQDENGQNFLQNALVSRNEAVVNKLLDIQASNGLFLDTARDREGATALLQAIRHRNSFQMINRLLELAALADEDSPRHKIWLIADNLGEAPLHAAARHASVEVFSNLVLFINNEPDRHDHLTRCFNEESPLVIAVSRSSVTPEIAACLINNYVLCLLNVMGDKISASCVIRLPTENLMGFFSFLNEDIRVDFLRLYRLELWADRELDRENYYRLSGLMGLRFLLAAKIEFDDREHFSSLQNTLYTNIAFKNILRNLFIISDNEGLPDAAKIQHIQSDLVLMQDLISQAERLKNDLHANRRCPPALVALGFLPALTAFILPGALIGALVDPFLGGIVALPIGVAATCISLVVCAKTERLIPFSKWQVTIELVRSSLLMPLQELESQEIVQRRLIAPPAKSRLPATPEVIRNLETCLVGFSHSILYISTAIHALEELKSLLMYIKQHIALTSTPFSPFLFHRPPQQVVEVTAAVENELTQDTEEEIELLRLLPVMK